MNFGRLALVVAMLAAVAPLSGCQSGERSASTVEFGQYPDGNWVVVDDRRRRLNEEYYSYAKVTCEPSGQARIDMVLSSESRDWFITDVYRSHGQPYLVRRIPFSAREMYLARKADRSARILVSRYAEGFRDYDYLVSYEVFDDTHPFPFALPACARDAFAAGGRERP